MGSESKDPCWLNLCRAFKAACYRERVDVYAGGPLKHVRGEESLFPDGFVHYSSPCRVTDTLSREFTAQQRETLHAESFFLFKLKTTVSHPHEKIREVHVIVMTS